MSKSEDILKDQTLLSEKEAQNEQDDNGCDVDLNEEDGPLHWKIRLRHCVYPFLGLLLTSTSSLLFTFSNVFVKWLEGIDPFTIAFVRFLVILILTIPSALFLKFKKGVPLFPEGVRVALIFRSILGSANLCIHFYGLKHLPLADTNLIAATAPIFTVISARLFLKEPIIILDLLNIAMVLIGIVLIVKPPFIFGDLEVYNTDPEFVIAVVAVILGAALLQANVYVLLRYLKDIPVDIILFNFGWVGSIVSGISALALGNRSLPQELNQWLLLLLMGFISYVAQLCLTASAKFESASKVSIYRKAFDIIFAFAFQILLFQEIPDDLKLVGAALITGAILSSGIKKLFEKKKVTEKK